MAVLKLPLALSAYRFLSRACWPAKNHMLKQRVREGREDPSRLGERLGHPSLTRPGGSLVWIHAGDLSEAEAAMPLLHYLHEAHNILITTSTLSAANFVEQQLPSRVLHQHGPVDDLAIARRFLDHWRPSAAIWVESITGINLLSETLKRGISTALVNGRMGERQFRLWRRWRPLVAPLLAHMDMVAAQSTQEGAKFRLLGARHVARFGNLKYATPTDALDKKTSFGLMQKLGKRQVWLAAGTYEGEEDEIAQAHTIVENSVPGLMTVILPRQPQRARAIARRLRFEGFRVTEWDAGTAFNPDAQICILDSAVDAGLFYHMAHVAYVGGSMVPRGGQNPLHPAHMACAILTGPHMDNFVEPTAELRAAGALQMVRDAVSLAHALTRLLLDPSLARQKGTAASRVARLEWVALGELIAALAPVLPAPDMPRTPMPIQRAT